MKENCKRFVLIVILFWFFGYCLMHISLVVSELMDYSKLFLRNVFPTSFLFFLISSLLMEYEFYTFLPKGFPHPLYFSIFLLSVISGFPSGAICVKDAVNNNHLSSSIGNKLILFAHFPNPLFVFYTVSRSFASFSLTLSFYVIFLLSNLFLYLFLPKEKIFFSSSKSYRDFSSSLASSLTRTFHSIFLIYGISLFFYLISCFLFSYVSFPLPIYVFLSGIFDLTNGVYNTGMISSLAWKGTFLFFFFNIGSLSIQAQIKSILSDTSISYVSFVKGRIFSFLLSTFIWMGYISFFQHPLL